MSKEFCKCGHSKKNHLIESHRSICCVMWQSRKTGFVTGCECSSYEKEEKSNAK